MRQFTLFIALLWAALLSAQAPTFSGLAPKRPLAQQEQFEISSKLRAFERLAFEEAALLDYLRAAPGPRPLRLQLGEHDWTMTLEAFDLRSPNYSLIVQTPQGRVELPRSATPTYKGTTSTGDHVVITIVDDFVSGWVMKGKSLTHFQSEWLHRPSADAEGLLVYAAADEIAPAERSCGTPSVDRGQQETSPSGKTPDAERSQVGLCFQVQLAIANDYAMFAGYNSNVTTLEARNLSVMAGVEGDYGSSFADDYFFPVVQQFISTCATCDPWTTSTEAQDLLISFTNWGGFTNTHDLGQLWTRRNFDGSTVGIAWVGAVCTPNRYHTIQDFTTNASLMRVTTSHEIGHNFDCDHDPAGSPNIMAPVVQNTSSWSALSIGTVNNYGPSRTCLSTTTCGGTGGGTSPPTAAFTGSPTNICPGQTVNFVNNSSGATSYSWTFIGGTPTTSTLPNPNVVYSQPGSYNVILVATNSAGSNTSQQFNFVTVVAQPVAGFTSGAPVGLAIQFTNQSTGSTSYRWDFGDGTTSTDVNPLHTFPNGGVYNVTLTAMNGCGMNSLSQTVNLNSRPTADFSAAQRQGCAPLTVNFTDQSTGSPTSFAWLFPGGNPATSSARNPTVVYAQPGDYDVELLVSGAGGSDVEIKSRYIVLVAPPVSGFGVSLSGSTVTITNQSSSGTGVSYTFGDGASSTQANPVYTYPQAGTFTITQSVAGTCGPGTSTRQVTILAPPVASFTVSSTSTCLGRPVTLTSTSTGNPSSISFAVTQPNGVVLTGSQSPFTFTPTQTGTHGVRLTVSNPAGSNVAEQAQAFTVLSTPLADFNVSFAGTTANFTGTVAPVFPGFAPTYSWDFGDGQSGSGPTPSHVYAQSGTFTVTLVATNGCSSDSESRAISVGATPSAVVTRQPGGTVCVGANVSYVATVSGNATSVTWSLPGSSSPTATGSTVQVTYAQAGNYSAEVTVCNALGCNTASLTGGTSVLSAPTAGFSISVAGTTVTVNSQAVGATSVSYTFAPGATASNPTSTYTYAQGGTYPITQTVTGPCGQNTVTQNVTIGGVPSVTASLATAGPFCTGQSIGLLATVTGSATSITWTIQGATASSQTGAAAQAVFVTPGIYAASVVACNALGCSAPALVQGIVVSARPVSAYNVSITGFAASFTSAAQNANAVRYDFGDGNASTQPNPVHTYAQIGTYRVLQTVFSACGQDTLSQRITIGVAPVANFSGPQQACVGASVNFRDLSSGNPTAWRWEFPGGTPGISNQQNPSVTFPSVGAWDVTLYASNAVGTNGTTRRAAISIIDRPSVSFVASVTGSTVALVPTLAGAQATSSFDFGNGVTAPGNTTSYTYPQPGSYVIRLTAVNPCGTQTVEQLVTILPPVVVASFNAANRSICPDGQVAFSSAGSQNATTLAWSFPGGMPATSSDRFPTVRYTQPGSYTVELVAINGNYRDTLTETNFIEVSAPPTAAFSATPSMLEVQFDNQSTAATSFAWDFGDGQTSTERAPRHRYAQSGVFTVVLTVSNACGSTAFRQNLSLGSSLPGAAFTVSATEGCAPFRIQFTDRSTGEPTAWLWTLTSLGGSALTSTERNPSFTLSQPGVYSVTLQVSNSAGTNSSVALNAIEIFGRVEVTAQVLSQDVLTVNFTSSSVGADSSRWDFGDGQTTSLEAPRHVYAAAGTYRVIFTAYGRCGASSDTLQVNVSSSGTQDLPLGASVKLFPNPSRNLSQLRLTGLQLDHLVVRVTDVLGKEVFLTRLQGLTATSSQTIDLPSSEWAAGSYFVSLQGDSLRYTLALVKLE